MAWVGISLLAILSQTVRNTFSKQLSNTIGKEAVSLCRFMFGLPIVLLGYGIARNFYGDVSITSGYFFAWIVIFSVAQITATALLVSLFKYKNFAVSITFKKAEGMFATILGLTVLSEHLSLQGWVGICVAFSGLLLASLAKEKIGWASLKQAFGQKSSYIGLLSGLLFAVSAITIKKSFAHLETDSTVMQSIFALLVALCVQVSMLLPWVYFKNREDLVAIFKKPTLPFCIGTFSGLGSFFWFFAFAIAYVAYVNTLSQLEFIFSALIAVFYFKEKLFRNEILGMTLMACGTVLVIFA